jgi:hypothetical protein
MQRFIVLESYFLPISISYDLLSWDRNKMYVLSQIDFSDLLREYLTLPSTIEINSIPFREMVLNSEIQYIQDE